MASPEHIGVYRKICEQDEELRFRGHEVDLVYFCGDGLYFNEHRIPFTISSNRIARKWSELVFVIYLCLNRSSTPCIALLRGQRLTPFTVLLLVLLRRRCQRSILDLPVFPYDNVDAYWALSSVIDRLLRPCLAVLVDLILYNGEESATVFGLPAIRVFDGFSSRKVKSLKETDAGLISAECSTAPITFVAVANFERWHGLDRFIEGIAASEDLKFQIRLHVVGEGGQVEYLKDMAESYNLDGSVVFHGRLLGKDLEQLYSSANIAVSSLAIHRIGLSSITPLKTAEYAAHGLPVVLGYEDFRFLGCDFCFNVPADESPVAIAEIFSWYRARAFDERDISSHVIEKLGWDHYCAAVESAFLHN